MSEDGNASPPGGPPKKRRRRRRGRKPGETGAEAGADSANKPEGDRGRAPRGRRPRSDGNAAASPDSGPSADKPRRSRRRRGGRRPGGEGRDGGEARPAPGESGESGEANESPADGGAQQTRSARGRRGGRGRDRDSNRGRTRDGGRGRDGGRDGDIERPDDDGPGGRERERARAREGLHARGAAPDAAPADVDLGWDDDDDPPASAPVPEPSDDEPAPQVDLSADLPPNPPVDDPDPSSYLADEDDGDEFATGVRNVVGVKFASAGKIYQFDAGDLVLECGDDVVVETDRGVRVGTVAIASIRKPHTHRALKRALRHPDANDLRTMERNDERGAEALALARTRARALKMPIKVFRASYALSGNKLQIYFTADERIDFRGLVRDLSTQLHARIEMRQTGVRDEAKMLGGIGSCGRELCCTTWMPDFVPVSIKMAKDQGLVLNPTKVSGQCGRLKCCLVYEQSVYAEMRKGLPRLGKRVVTEDGEGRVVEVDVLRQRIRVSLGGGEFKVFNADEVQPLFPSQQPRPQKAPTKPPADTDSE